MPDTQRGILIIFEGMEGASKSTQSKLFVDWLENRGLSVSYFREPNGPIRQLLLDPSSVIHDDTEALLFAASRVNTYRLQTEPALKDGQIVVCDRYVESSLAYQGHAGSVGMERIQHIHDSFIEEGHITLIFDIPVEVSRKRIASRDTALDRMEQKDISYHTAVKEGYLKIAENNPNVYLVDADRSIEDIHRHVISILEPLIRERGLL